MNLIKLMENFSIPVNIIAYNPICGFKLIETPNGFEFDTKNTHLKRFTEKDWQEMSYEGLLRTMLQKRP